MGRPFLLCAVLLFPFVSAAQKQGNIWYFGIQAGLDFNTTEPTPLLDGQTYSPLPNLWTEGTSSICDSSGVLLFYSNGAKIWNHAQEVMLNGDGLMGHPSSTHSALIVPLPGSERYFYVFTTDASENSFANGLRYSIVDICLDDGSGGVLPTAKNILLAGSMAEKLAAVRHANGEDYWVIGHGFQSNAFHAFLLSADGVVDTVYTQIGPVDVLGWGGQIVLTPDGTKLAYAYPSTWGSLNLFDFNTTTGMLSNARFHQNQIQDQSYGVAFSPDGTKLYVTTTNAGKVYQYDLSLGSWAQTVADRTLLVAQNPDSWRDVKLGPDNKIYITRAMRNYISRIENPDLAGTACMYVDQAIDLLGRQASFGLPSLITNYDYSNTKVDCVSQIGIEEFNAGSNFAKYLGNGVLSIELANKGRTWSLVLYDGMGRACRTHSIHSGGPTTLDLGSLPNGTYHVVLHDATSDQRSCTFVVLDGL